MKPPPSIWHSNVPDSSEVNSKVGVCVPITSLSAGPLVMVVSGSSVSTVKLFSAGVGSVLPAWSVAWTAKVCGPSANGPVLAGLEQEVNTAPSTEHSKVEPPSLEENSKVGEASLVGPEGPSSIVVSGGTVSTVKVLLSLPVLPYWSVAWTSKVWGPSLRPV